MVSALRARASFGRLLRRVEDERRSLVIEKRGTPPAVLMSIQEYARLSAPEPEVLRLIGEESKRKGTDALTSGAPITSCRTSSGASRDSGRSSAAPRPVTRHLALCAATSCLNRASTNVGRGQARVRAPHASRTWSGKMLVKNRPCRSACSDPTEAGLSSCADRSRCRAARPAWFPSPPAGGHTAAPDPAGR